MSIRQRIGIVVPTIYITLMTGVAIAAIFVVPQTWMHFAV